MNSRRKFLKLSTLFGAGGLVTACSDNFNVKTNELKPRKFDHLPNMMDGIAAISVDEHNERIALAQELMTQNGFEAIYLEATSNLWYYTGMRWGQSERMAAAIIPRKGEVAYICPMFEVGRLQERIIVGETVRGWEEHESPYDLVVAMLKDMGIEKGQLGIGEETRFFLVDGIRKAAPHIDLVSADPITAECRIIKSLRELELMQHASDITMAAYKETVKHIELGMRGSDINDLSRQAHAALGVSGSLGTMLGVVSSSPHGSIVEPLLEEGMIVLMDGGCNVHNYASDISRTFVFGNHTAEQEEVWNLEKAAQAAGFAAAQLGAPQENVDIAARKVITDAGYGPGYKTPGLPHRTGHGIGLDMHEWGNAVLGNKRPLEPGMCFSIEPTVSIPGKFGVRLEDCCYMSAEGPVWFTNPSVAIDDPFGDN
ncbi:MAG: aminopeptidase P family protein [Kordiimonadaceae bacterium]|jgi:Xaa-Pro dipeptidase|nr:aminopeptidase P family protein [Kordiimonadaceae bacterium]MDB4043990.1 Xaa-Pro peptidase family protein [Emcibacteraceae bacterium]MBT6135003.1 aminopeptidase P family protein [Kordiimonadaceae bacterium]MBT6467293.1 aminopeptidase P family protein [Kordiimonadaceae bacterium]MDB4218992.1 Xaa-Pro peptidase family protein [Emcibacteraceae bacterium]|tara:strand:- start:3406 stop:4686 length:1281 start_codon:yes stop_codon:yes gene_type:complete